MDDRLADIPLNDALIPIRHGVVAVITQADRLLMIRRSAAVAAPRAFCFPGGGIEPGETEPDALIRELREELSVDIVPQRRLWASTTPWRVALAWWRAALADPLAIRPNPAEVESCHWHTVDEMFALTELLQSNRDFLEALKNGQFTL